MLCGKLEAMATPAETPVARRAAAAHRVCRVLEFNIAGCWARSVDLMSRINLHHFQVKLKAHVHVACSGWPARAGMIMTRTLNKLIVRDTPLTNTSGSPASCMLAHLMGIPITPE